jgi:hypothetical protein
MLSGVNSPVFLQLNLGGDLQMAGNGPFTFPNRLGAGAAYAVSVVADADANQGCTVANASGTITANVSDVVIHCAPLPASVAAGGNIAGLAGQPLTLQLDAAGSTSQFTTATDGAFQFAAPLPRGTSYFVTVASQPAGRYCVVANAAGTATPGSDRAIGIACSNGASPERHAIGGTVTGLDGPLQLRLDQDNDLLTVIGTGSRLSTRLRLNDSGSRVSYSFGVPVPVGTPFRVTVPKQPVGHTCVVMNGGATMGNADITDIAVECMANVTDPLSGTFTVMRVEYKSLPGPTMTFYPDGVYVAATGAGIGTGVYRYTAATGELILYGVHPITSSTGAGPVTLGFSTNNFLDGRLVKTGAGQDQVMTTTGGLGLHQSILVPVPSVAAQLAGSFSDETRSFVVFQPNGRYLYANANDNRTGGAPAGVEYGCYTLAGTDPDTISKYYLCPDMSDGNGTAGLSGLGDASVPYRIPDPYVIDFGGLLPGSRVVPGR